MSLSWSRLTRSFPVGDRTAIVSLDLLRNDDGSPRFSLRWQPGPPARLSGEEIRALEAFKRQAILELTAELESDPAPPRASLRELWRLPMPRERPREGQQATGRSS